jgi:Na+/pantothenate symporter
MTTFVAAGQTAGDPLANIGIFALFVVITLFIVIRASRRNATTTEFFTGGRAFSGAQNGIAISGDYLSAASFLGIAGAIAVYGYDGFLYSIGFLVAWLVALLLVAELVRNTGKFTMADVLSFRLKQRPVRLAAATNTLAVSLFYLLAQMAGAGGLVALLLDVHGRLGQAIVIAAVGILMIVYVLVGGMKGTTWVQIIKAVLLIGGAAVMTTMVLAKFGFNFSDILGAAQAAVHKATTKGVAARDVLAPGAQYGGSPTSKINFISLALALVLGTAGLPHVLMRFYTVPTAKDARRSVVWAIGLIGAFYLFTLALGYGAAALVGPDRILKAPGAQNSAAPLLAYELGGVILLGVISAVAFDDSRGRRGVDHHRLGVVRARHLRKRDQTPRRQRQRTGARLADRRGGARCLRDRARHPGRRTECGIPGGARFRGRGGGEPPHDSVLAVLAAVQHQRRVVEHVRRADLNDRADRLFPCGVGFTDVDAQALRFRVVPFGQSRDRVDSACIHPRNRRHVDFPGITRSRTDRRDGGACADRDRGRKGCPAMSLRTINCAR